MIKQMAVRDAKAQMDDYQRRDQDNRIKSEASRALNDQMRAKQQQKVLSRQTDALYADQINKHNTMADDRDR